MDNKIKGILRFVQKSKYAPCSHDTSCRFQLLQLGLQWSSHWSVFSLHPHWRPADVGPCSSTAHDQTIEQCSHQRALCLIDVWQSVFCGVFHLFIFIYQRFQLLFPVCAFVCYLIPDFEGLYDLSKLKKNAYKRRKVFTCMFFYFI